MTSFFPEKNDQNNQRMTSLLRSEMSPPRRLHQGYQYAKSRQTILYHLQIKIMSQFGHLVKQKTRKHV
jgi:hypothetical protein